MTQECAFSPGDERTEKRLNVWWDHEWRVLTAGTISEVRFETHPHNNVFVLLWGDKIRMIIPPVFYFSSQAFCVPNNDILYTDVKLKQKSDQRFWGYNNFKK